MQSSKPNIEPKALRKQAGEWLRERRTAAGLSQVELAEVLGFKYYTFISQVENGFGRVPVNCMEAWARAVETDPSEFARKLLSYYDPELHWLLFKKEGSR